MRTYSNEKNGKKNCIISKTVERGSSSSLFLDYDFWITPYAVSMYFWINWWIHLHGLILLCQRCLQSGFEIKNTCAEEEQYWLSRYTSKRLHQHSSADYTHSKNKVYELFI